jgi:hypothetical protein
MAHHPDGRTSTASNFLIRLSSVRTMGDWHPDGYSSTRNFHISNARVWTMISSSPDCWSRIGNFLLWCTSVRTTAVRRLEGHFWIAILALRRRTSGRDTTSSGRLIDLPFLRTWKEIRNWSSTGRCLDILLKRPDGCKLAQKLLDTVWGPDGMNTSSGRDDTSSGRMKQRTDGRLDGIVESLFTASLHLSDFVQTQNEAKILTVGFWKSTLFGKVQTNYNQCSIRKQKGVIAKTVWTLGQAVRMYTYSGKNRSILEGGNRRPSRQGNLLSGRLTARIRICPDLGFL